MDFDVTEDQQALAEGIRSLLKGRFDLESIRRAEGATRTFEPAQWRELGEAGVFGLTLPEADGGVGLGVADATVVFEELGRALVPGPLVGTALAAGLVDGAVDGSAAVGVVVPSASPFPVLVEHFGALDALLVLGGAGESPTVATIDPTALTATALAEPLDPLTPMWRLTGAVPAGETVRQGPAAAALSCQAVILTAALQVGHGAEVLELAVRYAQERQQFNRPIGSFQAIKHMCADMLTRVEVARCAVHAAACLADQSEALDAESQGTGRSPGEVLRRAVIGAKLLADEAAVANARAAIQVHGGMGFTWEVPLHLHLKRSLVLSTTFGTAAALSEELADHL